MKTSNPIRRRYQKDSPLCVLDGQKDVISGESLTCQISGTRYGIVDGVVTAFGVNEPPIEDYGLRGCPAFTSYWYPYQFGVSVVYSEDNGWGRLDVIADSGYTFAMVLKNTENVGDVSYMQAIIKKGNYRYIGFRCMTPGTGGISTYCVFDFDTGDFSELYGHDKLFVIHLGNDEYHIGAKYTAVDTGARYFGICPCSSDGLSLSSPEINGAYVLFKHVTATINSGITALGTALPTKVTAYVSEVGSSANGTSFDLDTMSLLRSVLRGPDASGHVEFDFIANGVFENSTKINLLSCNNTQDSVCYIEKDESGVIRINSTDGTNIASSEIVEESVRVVIDFDSNVGLTINQSEFVDFTGSFGAEDLVFFFGNTIHAGWIKNLKAYRTPRFI